MPFGTDPLDALVVPDGTQAEERDIVTSGPVVVGGQSTVEFGVRGHSILAGERVRFGGGLEAEGDCRLDTWCDVDGNVLVGEDAYLGERVHVAGQLLVNGDLDVGDDAEIEGGFEANGFIHIRNPLPLYLFLVIYLTHLLRRGRIEDAGDILEAVSDEPDTDESAEAEDHDPLLVPRKSRVSDDRWEVSTPAHIGADCRLHGNFRARSIDVDRRTECYGSLRASGDVTIAEDVIVHGDVIANGGTVTVAAGTVIKGDVDCAVLDVHTDADVDGRIFTSEEVRLRSPLGQTGDSENEEADEDGNERAVEVDGDRSETSVTVEERNPSTPNADSEGGSGQSGPSEMSEAESVEEVPTRPALDPDRGVDERETGQTDDGSAGERTTETAGDEAEEIDGEGAAETEADPAEASPTSTPSDAPDEPTALPIEDAEGDPITSEPGFAPTARVIAEVEAMDVGGMETDGDEDAGEGEGEGPADRPDD